MENSDFFILHLHSTAQLGGPRENYCQKVRYEKIEWCGYRTVKKLNICLLERDRRTDGWTLHDCIGRAYA